jgi:hypothetical protein
VVKVKVKVKVVVVVEVKVKVEFKSESKGNVESTGHVEGVVEVKVEVMNADALNVACNVRIKSTGKLGSE